MPRKRAKPDTQSGRHITLKVRPDGVLIAFPYSHYLKPMTQKELLWLALKALQAALERRHEK